MPLDQKYSVGDILSLYGHLLFRHFPSTAWIVFESSEYHKSPHLPSNPFPISSTKGRLIPFTKSRTLLYYKRCLVYHKMARCPSGEGVRLLSGWLRPRVFESRPCRISFIFSSFAVPEFPIPSHIQSDSQSLGHYHHDMGCANIMNQVHLHASCQYVSLVAI